MAAHANGTPTERSYILGSTASGQSTPELQTKQKITKEDSENDKVVDDPASSDEKKKSDTPKRSYLTTAGFSLMSSILTLRIMGVAFAFKESGLLLGITILIVVAVFSTQSMVLQLKTAAIVGAENYQDVAKKTLGTPGFVFCSIFQFLFPFLIIVSSNIFIGDAATEVVIRFSHMSPPSMFAQRELMSAFTTFFITLPLSCLRNVKYLSHVSLVAVVGVVVVSVCMLFRAPLMAKAVYMSSSSGLVTLFKANIMSASVILSFAFIGHHTNHILHVSVGEKRQPNWYKVIYTTVSLSLVLYIAIGAAGYIPYTSLTMGNVLYNYCWKDDLMNICIALFTFSIVCTLPLEVFAARRALDIAFFNQKQSKTLLRHAFLTVFVVLLALGASLATDCTETLYKMNGLLIGCPLAFFLPSLMHMKATGREWFCTEHIWAWCILFFGILVMGFGMIDALMNIYSLGHCEYAKEQEYCYVGVNETFKEIHISYQLW